MNSLVQRGRTLWRHEKKKVLAMGGLAVVGLLLWGRLLLKDPPRTVTARPVAVAVAAALPDLNPTAAPRELVRLPWASTDNARDLFDWDPSSYKRTARPESSAQVRKLPEQPSDDALQTEAVRVAARGLALQSVLAGRGVAPHAVINGRLVRPGQVIEGFTVQQVGERHVTLARDGVIVRIGM